MMAENDPLLNSGPFMFAGDPHHKKPRFEIERDCSNYSLNWVTMPLYFSARLVWGLLKGTVYVHCWKIPVCTACTYLFYHIQIDNVHSYLYINIDGFWVHACWKYWIDLSVYDPASAHIYHSYLWVHIRHHRVVTWCSHVFADASLFRLTLMCVNMFPKSISCMCAPRGNQRLHPYTS